MNKKARFGIAEPGFLISGTYTEWMKRMPSFLVYKATLGPSKRTGATDRCKLTAVKLTFKVQRDRKRPRKQLFQYGRFLQIIVVDQGITQSMRNLKLR